MALKSISIPCRSPNSLHQLFMPSTTPRYSSFEECNSWDKACTSFEISVVCFRSSCTRLRTSEGFSCELFEFECQHCESLVNVVVKLSPDPGPFLLLRFDQLSTHT